MEQEKLLCVEFQYVLDDLVGERLVVTEDMNRDIIPEAWHFDCNLFSVDILNPKAERDYPDTPYVFVTERKGPLTTSAVRKIIARAGELAGLGFPVHPHMLRHACGFKLANDGHDTRAIQHYLGHKNIQHTVRYTELAPDRFNGFWKD